MPNKRKQKHMGKLTEAQKYAKGWDETDQEMLPTALKTSLLMNTKAWVKVNQRQDHWNWFLHGNYYMGGAITISEVAWLKAVLTNIYSDRLKGRISHLY